MKKTIMKFVIQKVSNGGCRLAKMEMIGQLEKTVDTPMCMLYTRGGSAPYLTKDMLQRIQDLPAVASMPLSLIADHHEALEEYGEGMGKFAAMNEFLVYTPLHDPSVEIPTGYNDKVGAALWGRGGKIKVDVDHFVKVQSRVKPDICQAVSDHDTTAESTRKRAVKSVDRTLTFLDGIIEQKAKSKALKNTELFGSLEGGYHIAERERSAKETAARSVSGFVIEGFHSMGPKSEHFDILKIEELLKKTLHHLPDDKPRVMQGVWPPDLVIQAVQFGIDLFDSCYPYTVSERGGALTFVYDYTHPVYPECTAKDQQTDHSGFEINLKNKKYASDFRPIVEGCPCYACQKFTRAYICHLLNTSELLAGVLLIIHNSHHYYQFFKRLRQALAEDKFQSLKDLILAQKT